MTTLVDFEAEVSAEMNKGSRYDTVIRRKVKEAVRFFERNYSMRYMRSEGSFTFSAAASPERTAAIPARLKEFLYLWYPYADGLRFLQQVPVDMITEFGTGEPLGFYLDNTYIRFDSQVTTDLDISYVGVFNSDVDSWTDSTDDIWLINNTPELIIAFVMQLMAPTAREPDWIVLYRPTVEALTRVLVLEEEALKQSVRDEVMQYVR